MSPEHSEEPPSKRQRLLACRRCRHRKQRCDDGRPCSNCQRSGEECVPTEPASRPQADLNYVKALEDRIASFESSNTRSAGLEILSHIAQSRMANDGSSVSSATPPAATEEGCRRRISHASRITDISAPSIVPSSVLGRRMSSRGPQELIHQHPSRDAAMDELHTANFATEHSIPAMMLSYRMDEPVQTDAETSPLASQPTSFPPTRPRIPPDTEAALLKTYRERAQAIWPIFHWNTFLEWHAEWNAYPSSGSPSKPWQGFFVNLVYATAILLLPSLRADALDERVLYQNAGRLLKNVLNQPDPVIVSQAYLLLAIHALHDTSTQRIMSLTSAALRFCVQQLFHLGEDEPRPIDAATHLHNQLRRRCFWSAYSMDRLVVASFDVPHSIPDAMISAKLYANVDDADLAAVAEQTPADAEIANAECYTCVSSSLHVVQCRRIQSEISQHTLRSDYANHYQDSLDWRARILADLNSYKARARSFSDPTSKGHTSQRWLGMLYHYALLMLYRPTKDAVLGPAGDWSVQASSQACLIFRRSHVDRQTTQTWLGFLVQFQAGITLLYCLWATPPDHRTENYYSPDVSDALRACSNTIAIMSDRWPKGDCLRDVFELLTREIPLIDRPGRRPLRLSQSGTDAVRQSLPQVRALVVNRSILRMVEEMISEDFPRGEACSSDAGTAGEDRGSPTPALFNRGQASTGEYVLSFPTYDFFYDLGGQSTEVPDVSQDELLELPIGNLFLPT